MTNRHEQFETAALVHTRDLLRFARRLTSSPVAAEDLVQDTLLLAWRGFDQFRGGTNARAWLFRILLNSFHGQKRRGRLQLVPITRGPGESSTPSGEDALDVIEALEKVPFDQRTVLLLTVVDGFTCREVAGILDIPIGTVMSRISRARQALRDHLGVFEKAHSAGKS